jgi:hypothetical protein
MEYDGIDLGHPQWSATMHANTHISKLPYNSTNLHNRLLLRAN